MVYFGETEDAKLANSRVLAQLGRAGHPRNAVWFCNQDMSLARHHKAGDTSNAVDAIDTATGRTPQARPRTQ